MIKFPNKHYYDNCGKHVHWSKRRIDKSTRNTKIACFFGFHEPTLKHVSVFKSATFHCKYCYKPLTL